MGGILGVGLVFLVANLHLPIVQNSFVYAKTALNIIDHGLNPLAVIPDPALSHGKPIAFSLLAVPFTLLFGVNAGVKIASFVGTAAFLSMGYFFFERLNRRAGIDPRFLPVELVLLALNPLVFYQFWSAYPDSLLAGLVLLAFVLTDIIVTEHDRDTRPLIPLLGLVIYAAILTKLYGMILGVAVPLYILLHLRAFLNQSSHVKSKVALLGAVFGVLGVGVLLAMLDLNPTLDFAAELRQGGGYAGYLSNVTNPSGGVIVDAAVELVLTLVLSFHLVLFFLLKRGARPKWPLAPTCFIGVFVLGLLPFSGTDYNMRFFLALLPFVVLAVVNGLQRVQRGAVRRWMLGAYVGVATLLTLNYNVQPVHRLLRLLNEQVLDPVLNQNRRIDNLRLRQHLALSERIEQINRVIEPGGTMYWASFYYGTATHGVAERIGIRSDINVQYPRRPSDFPAEGTVYGTVYRVWGRFSALERRFVATSLGSGVFRLVPLSIELTSPAEDDLFDPGELVPLKATAAASAETRVVRVEFLVDSVLVAVDTAPPYEATWRGPAKGRHVATARVHDGMNNTAHSASVTILVGIRAFERAIARSRDDAEERPNGSMYFNSGDLDLIEGDEGEQVVGLRFTRIPIPRGTQIRRAHLQFTADDVSTEPVQLTIQAELSGDAAPFMDAELDISSRMRTWASVAWSPDPWEEVGERSEKQRTPDLSRLIQEVVGHPDWQEGNALVLIVTGSGRREAEAFEGARGSMPVLYVELADPG